jgi:hypothetical protein
MRERNVGNEGKEGRRHGKAEMTMGKQHANGILNKKWGKQKSCLGQPTQVE